MCAHAPRLHLEPRLNEPGVPLRLPQNRIVLAPILSTRLLLLELRFIL
jgi:hypothetical protein